MILKEIHIDGFGIFNNFHLGGLGKGITILSGNNEAGKSTLLKFLQYTLFGYPSTIHERMEPLNGGLHGGKIKVLLSSGKEVLLERKSGKKGGPLTIHLDGKITPDPILWNEMLGYAKGELFNNVFAFTLDELRNLKSLSTSEVEDKIFSAGLGLGKVSLSDIEKELRGTTDNIYLPRGKIQQLPAILRNLNEEKHRIREAQQNLPRFENLSKELAQLKKDISEKENYLAKRNIEYQNLDTVLKCYGSFIKFSEAEEHLKALPAIQNYPANGITRLESLAEKEKTHTEKLEELKNGSAVKKGIYQLEKEAGAHTFNQNLLNRKDKVNYLRKNLERYKMVLSDKNADEEDILKKEQGIHERLKEINGSWSEEDIKEFSDLIPLENKLEDFKNQFDKIEKEKEKLEIRQSAGTSIQGKINWGTLAIVVSLILVIVSIVLFIDLQLIIGGGFLLTAILLFVTRNRWVNEKSKDTLLEEVDILTSSEKNLKNDFFSFLEQNFHLKDPVSVTTALKILNMIREIKKEINYRDDLQRKQVEQRIPILQKFTDEVNALKTIFPGNADDKETEELANLIISEFDLSEKSYRETENLNEKISALKREVELTKNQLEKTREEIRRLLETAGTNDRDNFRIKLEKNEQAKKLTEVRNAALQNIKEIAGYQKDQETIAYLKTHKKEDIESEKSMVEEEIRRLTETLKEKNKKEGELHKELEQMSNSSELAAYMTKFESQKEELRQATQKWLTGKIALKLLEEVKEKYEKEKQPAVLKNTALYLSKITKGRYSRVTASLDQKEVTIYDSHENAKKIWQLSRGTREQLLISLRLGFIEEYEKQAEPLPVVVDEILVNFDPVRARETAALLSKFARDRQVLLFTCHPGTKNFFDATKVNVINLNK